MRVFLGGTCNGTTWRDELIPLLTEGTYFNPVVDNWTEDCVAIEEDEKNNKCNIHLYVITKAMTGVYSIAEAVESCHNKRVTTIFAYVSEGFNNHQLKSLEATGYIIAKNGGITREATDMSQVAEIINNLRYRQELNK